MIAATRPWATRAAEATGDPTQGGFTYMIRPRELGVEVRYSFDKQ